jgi:hypothetical protein
MPKISRGKYDAQHYRPISFYRKYFHDTYESDCVPQNPVRTRTREHLNAPSEFDGTPKQLGDGRQRSRDSPYLLWLPKKGGKRAEEVKIQPRHETRRIAAAI